jgi:hypothetical protein
VVLLTSPLPDVTRPLWMNVPLNASAIPMTSATATVVFTVIPVVWLVAFALFKLVRACRRLRRGPTPLRVQTKVGSVSGDKRQGKELDGIDSGSPLSSHSEHFDNQVGTLSYTEPTTVQTPTASTGLGRPFTRGFLPSLSPANVLTMTEIDFT